MTLSQVPRELASNWVYKVHAWRGKSPEFMQAQVSRLEAVIREAIEKTLEEARNVACMGCKFNWPIEQSWPGERGTYHRNDNGPNTTVVKCNAEAIRSLKAAAYSLTEQETTK